ncbi:hypothetical protein ACE02V_19355 [Shewanella xiamenensis]|uniref:hypothetical protein n=1 Tax=Shewanella xiamenensis TaxID=332186 RepID=UPI0035BAF1C6
MALVLKKLQLIYVPFILLCLIFVSGYSLLHWLLIIEFQLLSIDESIINFWLPLILPWPLLFFYLRPRLKLFRFTKSNSRFIYFVIAVLLLAVPTIVAQEYLNSATGKLTQLESINALLHQPQTKYYQLNQFYIDKKHIGVQRNIEPIGKGNSELRMSLYIAMPIFAKRNESWSVLKPWHGMAKFMRKRSVIDSNLSRKKRYFKSLFIRASRILMPLSLKTLSILTVSARRPATLSY